jgi:hypothetical protein
MGTRIDTAEVAVYALALKNPLCHDGKRVSRALALNSRQRITACRRC